MTDRHRDEKMKLPIPENSYGFEQVCGICASSNYMNVGRRNHWLAFNDSNSLIVSMEIASTVDLECLPFRNKRSRPGNYCKPQLPPLLKAVIDRFLCTKDGTVNVRLRGLESIFEASEVNNLEV